MGIYKFSFFFTTILFALQFNTVAHAQQSKLDSMLSVLKNEKEDTSKVKTLNNIAREYELKGDNEKGIGYATQAKILAEKLNDKRGLAGAYNNLANLNYRLSNYKEALENNFAALAIREEIKDKAGISASYGNLGNVYLSESDYPKALEYYFKGLKIAEDIGDKKLIASKFGNISNTYADEHEYSKSLDYAFRGLKLAEELNDKKSIALKLGNIGAIYKMQGDSAAEKGNKNYQINDRYAKALDYTSRAVKLCDSLGLKSSLARSLSSIGNIYTDEGDYLIGQSYYFKAMKIDEKTGNKVGLSQDLANIGSNYLRLEKLDDAENYLRRALNLADSIGELDYSGQVEELMSDLYFKQGKFELSLEHYKKFVAANDSLFNEKNTKENIRTEMKFEFEKKQAEYKLQVEKKKLLDAATLEQQKQSNNFIIAGFILVLALVFFILRNYRQKQKANLILAEKNQLIEIQKRIVEEKNKDIFDSIHYAKRIQQSLLPTEKYIERNLNRLRRGRIE